MEDDIKRAFEAIQQEPPETFSHFKSLERFKAGHQLDRLEAHITAQYDRAIKELDEARADVVSGSMDDVYLQRRTQAITYLIKSFLAYMKVFYSSYSGKVSSSLHYDHTQIVHMLSRGVHKIFTEWGQISPILSSATDESVSVLETVIGSADPDSTWVHAAYVNVRQSEGERGADAAYGDPQFITLPYYGDSFALTSFRFAPLLSFIGIPISEFNTPWSWMIVWHEMAGHVAQNINVRDIAASVEQALKDVGDKLPEESWQKWLAAPPLPEADALTPTAEEILLKLEAAQAVAEKEETVEHVLEIEPDRPSWIVELLEDAYATISLGPDMLPVLAFVLREHYDNDFSLHDERHPAVRLRLLMTAALLRGLEAELIALDPEFMAYFEEAEPLESVAQIFRSALLKYIPLPFELPLAAQVNWAMEGLTGGTTYLAEGMPDSEFQKSDVRALVLAYWRWFYQNPENISRIAEFSRSDFRALAEQHPLEPFSKLEPHDAAFYEVQLQQVLESPEVQARELLRDKKPPEEWQTMQDPQVVALLEAEFSEIDHSDPGKHDHGTSPFSLDVKYFAHGIEHKHSHRHPKKIFGT